MKVSSYLSDSDRLRQRGRRRLLYTYGFGVLGLLLIGAAWAVRYAPIFDIKSIVVEGNRRASADEVLTVVRGMALEGALARFIGIERLFAWPEKSERNLALLPAVAELTISKSFRSREVRIAVAEREPVGIWCFFQTRIDADITQMDADETNPISDNPRDYPRQSASSCWWFDKSGVLFARAPGGEGGLLKTVHDYSGRHLGAGSTALPPPLMERLLMIFDALRESGAVAGELRFEDVAREEVEVATLNGPRLYFSLRFPLAAATDALRQIFSASGPPAGARLPDGQGFPPPQKLQYVDFRVENRVYYK
ncbi:MAG: hypothetical protein HYW65_03085 [Candidatus Liptonbacteria bacterium]|nr:hypothetical protein [Candidatus Liptonbacteria bacterium]